MELTIHSDGSFDITVRKITLADCYPGINGTALRATQITVADDTVNYRFRTGSLQLRFTANKDCLRIFAEYEGEPIQTLHILNRVLVKGEVSRYYLQGHGTGGPCETGAATPTALGCRQAEAHTLIGIGGIAGCLMFFSEDVTSYAQHSTLFYEPIPRQWNGWQTWAEKALRLDARFELENVRRSKHTVSLAFLESGLALAEGMRAAAKLVARHMAARNHIPPLFHWCSWYEAYDLFSYDALEDALNGMRKKSVPFQFVQIDAGYAAESGDWLSPNTLWPGGLQRAFTRIIECGYQPGVWVAPFLLSRYSQVVTAHPDWILRGLDGQPVNALICYGERKLWHSRSETYWVLDTTHPEALAYLVSVFQHLRDWGARLFKTDFISCGVWNSAAVLRHDPSITSTEALRQTMAAIRAAIGEDSILLGCIAPFAPMIGYADAMRIGGDVGAEWKAEGHGPVNMIQETKGAHFFNHIYWQNDPDAMMLRSEHSALTEREAQALAIHQAISGGSVNTSDRVHRLPESRMALLRFVTPDSEKRTPWYPDAYKRYENLTIACHTLDVDRHLVWLFNAGERNVRLSESFEDLLPISEGFAHEQGTTLSCGVSNRILADLAPHEGRLFFVTVSAPLAREPGNLWSW